MRKALVITLFLVLPGACQSKRDNSSNVSQTPARPASTETPRQSGLPTDTQLRAAIERTYADAVVVDNTRSTQFIVGDFNGDNSEDIAIVVKPRKVSELNSEYVNWTLEDVYHPQQVSRNVRSNDTLLAVIHGNEREGWRNDLARQTYLLKNAVGTDFTRQSLNQLKTSGENKALPQLRGDVIREKLNGSGGIIYSDRRKVRLASSELIFF